MRNRIATALGAAIIFTTVNGMGIFQNETIKAPCDSQIYCFGNLLRDIQLARPFSDSKTFVDMPTRVSVAEVQKAYDLLPKPVQNDSNLLSFLSQNFAAAGDELHSISEGTLAPDAAFLTFVNNSVIREFVEQIIDRWPNLTRVFNGTKLCDDCDSSFIPVKRPFVIAGGRFREPYYWDSYWILQGLLRSAGNFTRISNNQIENFLDNIEEFGFVPNGARKYYLNRSQPPLLPQMVKIYLEFTKNVTILDRGLPLLIQEYDFFARNRSVDITVGGQTYTLHRYNVENNQPRPESYREDWQQVNNDTFYSSNGTQFPAPTLTQAEKDFQYRNLASGAESGWDFSSRFMSNPRVAAEDDFFPMASYNIVNIIPVDLNSLLYWNEVTIAAFLRLQSKESEAAEWDERAVARSQAMHALMWNEDFGTYFDYNLTSCSQALFTARDADAISIETNDAPSEDTQLAFNVAQLMPFLTGAAPSAIRNDPTAVRRAFERVSQYLDTRKGGISPTNYRTNQQWDQPNVWPPHMQMLMEALVKLPPTKGEADEDWQWTQDLALRLGQRYLDSAYCTWRATGGETKSSPKADGIEGTAFDVGGIMYEKYSDASLNEAGSGGEYKVVEGFGWTNGVLIWVADTFRDRLATPSCPDVSSSTSRMKKMMMMPRTKARSAVEMDHWDARWLAGHAGGST